MPASTANIGDNRAYRPQITKLSRSELEDEYYRILDQNHSLKLSLNSQAEKIKQLAVKVIKNRGTRSEQDVDTEELQIKNAELEKQNHLLRDKLQAAKHQLTAYARIPLSPNFRAYAGGHRKSGRQNIWQLYPTKTETPAPSTVEHSPQQQIRGPEPVQVVHPSPPQQGSQNVKLYERAITALQEQVQSYEQEIFMLKDSLLAKQSELEDTELKTKSQQASQERGSIQENIDMIRLQRQLREKSTEAAQSQAKFTKAEQDLRTLKMNHDLLIGEFDQQTNQLRIEQNRIAQMQAQIASLQRSHDSGQYHEEIENLKRENLTIKETNEKLLSNVLTGGKDDHRVEQERRLRAKITELEHTIKADVNTRDEILEKLASEISARERLEDEFRKLEVKSLQTKAELEASGKKIARLTQGGISWSEIEEALGTIKAKKETQGGSDYQLDPFITVLPESEEKDTRGQLEKLRVAYAETVQELEQTRNMLLVQYNINQKTQKEIELVQQQAEYHKLEYERHLRTMASTLDERALRIQRLESYLQNMAYGKKPFKLKSKELDQGDDQETVEPGQNLLDIHFSKLSLTKDGAKWMQSGEPSVFLTMEFFDFEIQFTPVLKGPVATMDFTCQYAVTVSDLFLHFLQTDFLTVELHQAVGTVYKTWATGPITLRNLLPSGDGKCFGSLELHGVSAGSTGILFGNLDFSVHFKVPFERSLQLYKERVQALGYVLSDLPESSIADKPQSNNQLQVSVHRCKGLKSRAPDNTAPSSYVLYQLMDFPEHDTPVILKTASPEYADKKTWPIPITTDAHNFMRTKFIQFLVFDDDGPTDDLSFIGAATVPLLPLIHDKPIIGSFELYLRDPAIGTSVGTIDVSINWQYTYIPPKDQLLISQPMVDLEPEKDLRSSYPQHGADSDLEISSQASSVIVQGTKRAARILPRPEETEKQFVESKTVVEVQTESTDGSSTTEQKTTAENSANDLIGKSEERPVPRERSGSYTIQKTPKESSIEEVEKPINSEAEPVAPPRKPARVSSFTEASPQSIEATAPQNQRRGSSETSTEEDEDVVVAPLAQSASSPASSNNAPATVRFEILSLSLPPGSRLLKDKSIDRVFVEWKFLDLPNEDCETPNSVKMPRNPNEVVLFDCIKKTEMTPKRLDLLQKFLLAGGNVEFSLVSDPGTNPEAECVDLCAGKVDLNNLRKSGKDLKNTAIPMISEDGKLLANLRLSIIMQQALKASVS